MKLKSLKLVTFAALAAGHSHAALLLQSPVLGGSQESVSWEQGSLVNDGSGTGAPSAPTSGTGSIVPIAPGYRASAGYYSWGGSFGLTATTEAIGFSDIQSVVFQRVSMANPLETGMDPATVLDLNLNWDGNVIPGLEGYGSAPTVTLGGPWLSYFDADDNLLGRITPTNSAIIASAFDVSVGPFSGDIYSFAYQWDLSGVAENVARIQIDAPIFVHSSTIEARIDIGDNYAQVIPEPSAFLLGCAGFALILRRRR